MDVIITGTSNGLGKELRKNFTSQKVLVINRTPTSDTNELICDLSSKKGVENTLQKLLKQTTSKEVLFVLNAGTYGEDETINDISLEGLSKVIYTNVFSQLSFVESLLAKGKQVKLIAISSQMASIKLAPEPYHFVYGVSKAGLNLSVRLLQRNYENLDYFLIDPGWMQTQMGGEGATDDPSDVANNIIEASKDMSNWNRADGMYEVNKKQIVPW